MLIWCQLPVATLLAKSLRCVNRTRSNKEIMITMRDFGLRILKGNLIATSLIGTDESLRKIDFFG